MFVYSKTAKTDPSEEDQNVQSSKKTGKRAKTGSEDNQNEEDPIAGSALNTDDPNDMAFPNTGGSEAINKASALQQNGSALNNKTGKFNKFGSSGIQKNGSSGIHKNGSAQNMSGSSAAIKSSAKRQVHSESALTRAESGSGSGIKKSNSGSFGSAPNEEDEIENEISELVSNFKSLVLHT